MRRAYCLGALLGLLLGAGCARQETPRVPAPAAGSGAMPVVAPEARIRGVTLDARRPVPPGVLMDLKHLGVTHVFVIPFGWMDDLHTPEVRFRTDAGWFSESDNGIGALAREADSLGLRLALKPHLWVRDGAFVGDVAMRSEADWRAWERSYGAFILDRARLAARVGADVFVIGTELGKAVRARPEFFRRLIRDVRALYPGRLTYAANWYDDAEHVAFWRDLDFVGVQAYFPLSTEPDPSLDALRAGWQPPRALLERLARSSGRPVLFTEMGYRSTPGAAATPWTWPERGRDEPADSALQARLYEATFQEVWPRAWFAGVVVWKFEADTLRRARRGADFTPQGKPAERVLRRYFTAVPAQAPQ